MATWVLLAFAVDALTTLLVLRLGAVEVNPLVAGLAPAAYGASVVLRAGLALGLLALARGRPAARRVVVGGLAGLVAVKLVAAASNVAIALAGGPLVTPTGAPALVALGLAVALIAGSKVHDPRPRRRVWIS